LLTFQQKRCEDAEIVFEEFLTEFAQGYCAPAASEFYSTPASIAI
jgi:hypothetical protein